MIPIKDASLIARCEDSATRREWRSRLVDHDGARAGEGGIARWLKLTDGLGLDRDYVASLRGLLPATRFAVDAYVHFVREKSLLEAIASSLTELFSPRIIGERMEGMLKSYDFVTAETLAYFSQRPPQAERDSRLRPRLRQAARTHRRAAAAVLAALEFKCDVLWAMLDALSHAYVAPGQVPARRVRAAGSGAHVNEPAAPIADDARPRLPRGVRLVHNEAQGGWVLLAPERVFKADAIAVEVVKRCTGEATVRRDRRRAGKDLSSAARRMRATWRAAARPADKRLWNCETWPRAALCRCARTIALGGRTLDGRHRTAQAGREGKRNAWQETARRCGRDGAAERAALSPLGLLAELTHRCPLGCPYCSNPLALDRRGDELDTATWARVFKEAAALGVLQVHLSGGEPAARRDLVEIMAAAHDAGLYTNLITSAVGITAETLRQARRRRARPRADLDPGQRARPPPTTSPATRAPSRASARSPPRWCGSKIPLTVNAVMHRANIDHVERHG